MMAPATAQMTSVPVIIALPGNEAFAQALANAGAGELGAIETRSFPDGESYVRLACDVAAKSVLLVSTLARPDEGFLRLVFLADAARSLGATAVTLIAPYLAYMRTRQGERIEITMRNASMMAHPMHLHGHHFQVTNVNGTAISGAVRDTALVPPGETLTFVFDASNPGKWPLHCHHLYHMATGMMAYVTYEDLG